VSPLVHDNKSVNGFMLNSLETAARYAKFPENLGGLVVKEER
jgi:hypothetical protein